MNNYYEDTPVLDRPTLRYGDNGEYVKLLQSQLKNLTFYNGNIDGFFGDSTTQSVKYFQANNQLLDDGIVGKDTWSALIYLYSPLSICSEYQIHTVKAGETLWGISRLYNTSVDEIKNLNNLSTNTLNIGQQLKIPKTITPPSNNITYTVQKGDTLWSIANKYNTSVNEIKSINSLTSNTLNIGQQLIIPSTENITIYTVQPGDTLWGIANKYNTTVDKIKTLNNLTSSLLNIGQTLKIPK